MWKFDDWYLKRKDFVDLLYNEVEEKEEKKNEYVHISYRK